MKFLDSSSSSIVLFFKHVSYNKIFLLCIISNISFPGNLLISLEPGAAKKNNQSGKRLRHTAINKATEIRREI